MTIYRQPSLWESERSSLEDSLALTAQSLNAYGSQYDHWAIAFSGGKDSSAALAWTSSTRTKKPASSSWSGDEPLASDPFDNVNPDGSIQPIMRELISQ